MLVVGSLLDRWGCSWRVPTLAVVMVVLRRILINRIYEGHGFRRASARPCARSCVFLRRRVASSSPTRADLDVIAFPVRAA